MHRIRSPGFNITKMTQEFYDYDIIGLFSKKYSLILRNT